MLQTNLSNQPLVNGGKFRPQLPYHMVWLATNACNARCVHCSSDAAKCLPHELTTLQAKQMFDDLAAIGIFDVAVSGGEPLTRRDIFEVMEHAINRGIRLGLGSNGSTVTPKVARRLKQIGLNRLQISIDGLEETHDRARRWKGLFQKSIRAIKTGLDEGLQVHVCFTAHRLNFRELGAVIDQCVSGGVRRFNMSRLVPTGRGDASLDLTPGEWKELVEAFELKRAALAGQMEFSTHLAQLVLVDPTLDCTSGFVGCQAGLGQGCIGPEGDVTPCVMLPVVVGNVRDKSLEEIWHSSPIIRSLQDRSNLKGWCQTCDLRENCGGCRGIAYSYTGDLLAADPRCWLYAEPDKLPTVSRSANAGAIPIHLTRSRKEHFTYGNQEIT
jgi:radical SAM protein with 4Fe4S-binding SPASM domain